MTSAPTFDETPYASPPAIDLDADKMPAVAADAATTAVAEIPADSFAVAVTSMAGLSIVQKLVGLARNLLMMWLLSDGQLGLWATAIAFLITAAPIVVLGLPGSFGKYVEHFRQRHQLVAFLRRTSVACGVFCLIAAAGMLLNLELFANWVYHDRSRGSLFLATAGVLLITIVWNFLSELLTALRQIRAAAFLQFLNGVLFTVVSVALACGTEWKELAIIVAYGVGNLITAVGVLWFIRPAWRIVAASPVMPLSHAEMWRKVVPYAASIWIANLLTNTFTYCTQFMLPKHLDVATAVADSMSGQFYASRVIPLIMITLGAYLGTVIQPYLSHDWEKGNRRAVSDRMNFSLKGMGLVYCFAAAIVLLFAPLAFHLAWQGKYDDALRLVPMTLAYCAWLSLLLVAQNYLWCVEKAWLSGVGLLLGLATNVGLNVWLIPRYGLDGAVVATACANGLGLASIYVLSWLHGLAMDRGVVYVSLIPLALCLENWLGSLLVVLAVGGALASPFVFRADERRHLFDLVQSAWRKVRGHVYSAS